MAAPITCALSSSAGADRGETRFSLQLRGETAELSAFESTGANELYGGGLAVAYGFRNWLDAGFAVGYQRRSDAVIDDAIINGVGGTPAGTYFVFADVQALSAAATVRTYLEAGRFLLMRPLLGLRVGGELTQFALPQLFAGDAPASEVAANKWEFAPFGGAEIGAAYRFTDSIEAALLLTAARSRVQTSFGLMLEVSWQRI